MRQFKNNCSGLKIDWGSPPGAAIYTNVSSVDSAYKHDSGVVSAQARNLLRRNNLSGDLTDDCANNFMCFYK